MPVKYFAVIGDPVGHSLSPALHNWVFEQLDLEAHYEIIEAKELGFAGVIDRLRSGELEGINVTIPYKQKVVSHLDSVSPETRIMGVANCVVRKNHTLTGFDTDWIGFSRSLQRNGVKVRGGAFVILGAGGAARAVLYSLLTENVGKVCVVNRHVQKAKKIISLMSDMNSGTDLRALAPYRLASSLTENVVIVNCTPVGMSPNVNATPLSAALLRPGQTVVDIIYSPRKTRLLSNAERLGAKTVNGLDMFIFQGLASLDLWFSDTISERVNVNALRAYLEDKL